MNLLKVLRILSRYLIGITFVFSGFVKGQDPLGTVFKIEDYFIAYGWEWAMPFALVLSIVLCTAEFTLGAALLANARIKLTSWLVLLMMSFFTVVTFFDALYNPVPDCGCFGDAIKLTNWETFYKNIVLMVFVAILFISQRVSKPILKTSAQYGLIVVFVVGFAGFSIWSYKHLPIIDFMPWKIGANMYPERPLPVTYFVTYKNATTGEVKEYPADNYPYNDSLWLQQWKFVSTRVADPNTATKHNLMITDTSATDVTDTYLKNTSYQFIVVSYDLTAAKPKILIQIAVFGEQAAQAGYGFIMVTPALPEDMLAFKKQYNATFELFNADDVVLKTMVRANPGLLVFKDGIVVNKWNWRDVPDFKDLTKAYPLN